MSLYDYQQSLQIDAEDYGFYALVMAAMRNADEVNLLRLRTLFPEVHSELSERYNAPGGILPGET